MAEPALPERQQKILLQKQWASSAAGVKCSSLLWPFWPRTPVRCFTLPVLEPLTLPRIFLKWYRQNSSEYQITRSMGRVSRHKDYFFMLDFLVPVWKEQISSIFGREVNSMHVCRFLPAREPLESE